ncbi:PREDICTED: protein-S-isoprenylcysteine O-methyltransferase [Papilio xuthus]|uniref:Protein-S-isoprenylcysteine O-methyltransferase n=1 Tax=Papilio xuthus TaxID=66420 RepID=A0AAJ6ZDH5_PAPXU|nr:PREDICTED: protein-S-isoprenylcysteine O-methyltransferase [Papilio xuthus]
MEVIPAAKQALMCFLISNLTFIVCFLTGVLGSSSELWALKYWGPALYFCLINFVLKYCYKGFIYEVSIRATGLGAAMAVGLYLVTFDNGWKVFGLYTVVLTFFHFSEFVAVALSNPKTVTIDSFILNHSVQYAVAAVASWVEWAVEYYFFPDFKTHFWISSLGVVMCIGGELIRKTAMFTAKHNFSHTVEFVKRPEHQLVTHGVYSLCRHPSYVGWFYWSIGTQIILLNPICVVVYALTSWTFFRERVYAEEMTLLGFFGIHYDEYQKKVGTGLPFILGYVPENRRQKIKERHWSY